MYSQPNETQQIITQAVAIEPKSETDLIALTALCKHVLRSKGIPTHLDGFTYLVDAVIMCIGKPFLYRMMTKTVYPDIAARYGKLSSNVERCIRSAIDDAYQTTYRSYMANGWDTGALVRPKPSAFISIVVGEIADLVAILSQRGELETYIQQLLFSFSPVYMQISNKQ